MKDRLLQVSKRGPRFIGSLVIALLLFTLLILEPPHAVAQAAEEKQKPDGQVEKPEVTPDDPSTIGLSQSVPPPVEERVRRLEEGQKQLELEIEDKNRRIQDLEGQINATDVASEQGPNQSEQQKNVVSPGKGRWGAYEPGKGFVVVRTEQGELAFSLWTYVRYLNQKALRSTSTDEFGVTSPLHLRQDVQINKVNLYFKGWIFNPKLRYVLYVWTTNATQGLPAQVVEAGYLSYEFIPQFHLYAGIGSLPSTRTTQGTFPFWLKVDHRTIADEFFRGSYTTGFWADGKVATGLKYKVMVGNNLSQLGVDAGQLDNLFNTVSGAVWWMPTTGEFGPSEGYGDFEDHDRLATLFGLRFTRSREDKQSQPNTEDPDNTQIRLSNGTVIFDVDALAPGTQINRASYRMLSTDAGLKHRGLSLDGEYFARWLDNFSGRGPLPMNHLFDQGFQVQGSAMVRPQSLQAYIAGSKILGQFGKPWDLSVGMNWFPLKEKTFRVNNQLLYLKNSPVGYLSVPFPLGGKGFVYNMDIELIF